MTTEKIAEAPDESGASSSGVVHEQETTRAESSVVKTYWVDRPDVVIRVHKIPRRRVYIPVADGKYVPHSPTSAIDASRRTITNLEHADVIEVDDVWRGDENDSGAL